MNPTPMTTAPAPPTGRDAPEAEARLELAGVSKSFGKVVAVDDVSLRLADGEFLTFLGQSGSGKSTILKLVAGFESCDDGSIRIGGKDVAGKPPRLREIGMVFQQYALFPHMTVAENIAYGLRRRRWPSSRRRARVDEMLQLIRLEDLGQRYPSQLSGGQQQRVAVARALAFEPELLLMDEPLGALDRALRLDLEQELRRIHRSAGCSVLYVTHDRDEALALSDRIGVFHDGSLVCLDTPEALYGNPPTGYTARLLTDANLLPLPEGSRWSGTEVDIPLGAHQARIRSIGEESDDARIAIPRTAIQVGGVGDARITATVVDAIFLGEHVKLDVDAPVLGRLTAHLPGADPRAFSIGQTVDLTVDVSRCSVVL